MGQIELVSPANPVPRPLMSQIPRRIEKRDVCSYVKRDNSPGVHWDAVKVSNVSKLHGFEVREYQVVMRGRRTHKKKRN